MIPIRTFIANRRAEIRQQIEALQAELRDLDVAEAALDEPSEEQNAPQRPKTFKGMAIEVLRDHPAGLDANRIRQEMEARYGIRVMRESLSPQLSRLRIEEILFLQGNVWRRTGDTDKEARYVPPPQENEPSGIKPDGSETRSQDGSHPSQEHMNSSRQGVFE